MKGFKNLGYAIVEQAFQDYWSLCAGYIEEKGDCNKTELERFFREDMNGYFDSYIDPEIVINTIRSKAEAGDKLNLSKME